jgi:diguanylate cyclase (GGDEF)-like protein
MIASVLAALVAGRLCAWPTIARLRARLAHTSWALRRDPLTGLLNRTGLTEAHAARQQTQQHLTLVLIDLDGFKAINDTHGHDVGDQLLIAAADRIHDAATMYGGITARLAGDEFVVLLPVRNDDLDRPVELLLAMLSAPATAHAESAPITLNVTASAGVCRAKPTDDLDTLLRQADVAMYHAKHNGGARHTHHHPGMAMPIPTSRKGPRLRDRRREVTP